MPRHYGRMRVPGSIIWATDLVERRDKRSGGKGKPSVTSYSYSASFAVALASRPITGIGRIWADGNLLRGAVGDLKAGGTMRLHTGERDQKPDPLIAAAEGAGRCPGFRGIAYAVFEDLKLGDFGNRIPALSFEVFGDEGGFTLQDVVGEVLEDVDATLNLPELAGISCEGPLAEVLAQLEPVYPMDCDACGDLLTIARARLSGVIALPEPAISVADGDFGGSEGHSRKRAPFAADAPEALRYYDVERDYQPGVQRAAGRPRPGQQRSIELPAALAAAGARALAEKAARRATWARETLSWRTSELDPAVAPGAIVTVPGETGRWRIVSWEWRSSGVELALQRVPPAEYVTAAATDPGRANPAADLATAPTALIAFELPWDGSGSGDTAALFAAVSSSGSGWTGAALYVDQGDGGLESLGTSGRSRSIAGFALAALAPSPPHLFDRSTQLFVELLAAEMVLPVATTRQLAMGANRALLGGELIQFAQAVPLGGRQWQLGGLLRGRAGTADAIEGHFAGEAFVLLDGTPLALDAAIVGASPTATIAAIGLGDSDPVVSAISCRGATLRPVSPVHPKSTPTAAGELMMSWTRRARGGWIWNDGVDTPLHEQSEAYQVSYGPPSAPLAIWQTFEPRLTLDAAALATLSAALPGGSFHVRQRGSYALSPALRLATLT